MSSAGGWVNAADQLPDINDAIELRLGDNEPYPGASSGFVLHRYAALYGSPENIFWRPSSSGEERT